MIVSVIFVAVFSFSFFSCQEEIDGVGLFGSEEQIRTARFSIPEFRFAWGRQAQPEEFNGIIPPPQVQNDPIFREVNDLVVYENDAGKEYIFTLEVCGHRVQKFTDDGIPISQWGSLCHWADGGAFCDSTNGASEFYFPTYMALHQDSGFIYVSDMANHRVQKFDPNGRFLGAIGERGSGIAQFDSTSGITVDETRVYVADRGNQRVLVFDLNLEPKAIWDNPTIKLFRPAGMASNENSVFICDSEANRIVVLDKNGRVTAHFGEKGSQDGEFDSPQFLTVDPTSGYLFIVDRRNLRIQVFTSNGQFIGKWGTEGQEPGEFMDIVGLTISTNGFIYVADQKIDRIQKFELRN